MLMGDLRLAWEPEFEDDGTSVRTAFVAAPGNLFDSRTPSQSSDFNRIGTGLTKDMGINRSLAATNHTRMLSCQLGR